MTIRALCSNERGTTLITGLVAAAIVTTTAVGTASLGTYLWRQSRRTQGLNRVVTLKSDLEGALLSKSQWAPSAAGNSPRDAQIADMANGVRPAGLVLTNGDGATIATVGQRTNFDLDGRACAGGEGCPIYVDLDIQCGGVATGCGAAYRVGVRAVDGLVSPAPLGAALATAVTGAPPNEAVFSTGPGDSRLPRPHSDYVTRLSYDFFAQKPKPTCRAGTDILVTGMNRTTGDVACVSTTTETCGPHQVANTVIAADGKLKLKCHPLGQVQCPPDYVLQKFNFGQLDRGDTTPDGVLAGLRGTCVYRWRDNVPFPAWDGRSTSSSLTISQQVCNAQIYDPGSTRCQAAVTDNKPGYCPGNPPSIPGYATSSSVSVSSSIDANNVATCTISITNSCGSSMTAHETWTGTCTAKERARNNSLLSPPVNGSF